MSVKDDMTGAALLADWLGSGEKPVDQMTAEFRSQRCLAGNNGKPCDKNVELGWWDRVKSVIADWVRAELGVKNGMNLKVADEDKLGVCACCRCPLPLKVWTPTVTLSKHVPASQLENSPAYCWLRKELL